MRLGRYTGEVTNDAVPSPRSPRGPSADGRIAWLHDKYQSVHPEVYAKLLALGGDAAVMHDLGWFERAFLERADVSTGPARRGRGRGSHCHRNASKYFRSNPARYHLVSGFALSWDEDGVGCWRPHSWAFDTKTKEIVETTLPRAVYAGVTLTPEEADEFAREYDGD